MRDDERVVRGGRALKAIGFVFFGAFAASGDSAFLWWFGGLVLWGQWVIERAEERIAELVRRETDRFRRGV